MLPRHTIRVDDRMFTARRLRHLPKQWRSNAPVAVVD